MNEYQGFSQGKVGYAGDPKKVFNMAFGLSSNNTEIPSQIGAWELQYKYKIDG